MASLLFDDIDYPSDLYTRTGEFTAPIQELLLFAPRIYQPYLVAPNTKNSQSATPWYKSIHVGQAVTSGVADAAAAIARMEVERRRDERERERREEVERLLREERERKEEERSGRRRKGKETRERSPSSENDTSPSSASQQHTTSSQNTPLNTTTVTLTKTTLTTTFTLLSLLSTYQASKHHGHSTFTTHFRTLLSTSTSLLTSTNTWIKTRNTLSLPVPSFILRDVRNLQTLIENLHRLDMGPTHDTSTIATWTAGAVSTAMIAGGTAFSSSSGVVVAKVGMAGLVAACFYGASLWGRYASGVYTESFEVVSRRAEGLVKEIEGGREAVGRVLRDFGRDGEGLKEDGNFREENAKINGHMDSDTKRPQVSSKNRREASPQSHRPKFITPFSDEYWE
ncbi:hypothetical protein HK097_007102 [Rhizophlyctis rosea]|uniref:Uncharacterized protein n=1 Tax=Rhizophlyctis rosea TaxID=64517 RepID=A0AAD5SK06_9FUNG|nr:hypothetical protein HK097_007102 [Rhizophlyctis rosea]